MARSRLELDTIFRTIVDHVYYQPPTNIRISYPCIIYELSNRTSDYADNGRYLNYKSYEITLIDKNPDSELPDKILELPMCKHDRRYVADNLNHDTFTIYF